MNMETEELIKQCLRLSGCNKYSIEYSPNEDYYMPYSILLERTNSNHGYAHRWSEYKCEKLIWEETLGVIVRVIREQTPDIR